MVWWVNVNNAKLELKLELSSVKRLSSANWGLAKFGKISLVAVRALAHCMQHYSNCKAVKANSDHQNWRREVIFFRSTFCHFG